MDAIKNGLIPSETPVSDSDKTTILEQYKLYVEMADRISTRRDTTNGFFLTLNTLALGIIGFLLEKGATITPKYLAFIPVIAFICFCVFWFRIIKSYRQLNSVKFELIGELENYLPAKLWGTEWKKLGEGKDNKKYSPLSELEEKIPFIFMFLYVVVLFVLLLR